MSRFARIDGEPVYSDLKPERCPQFLDERKRTELRRIYMEETPLPEEIAADRPRQMRGKKAVEVETNLRNGLAHLAPHGSSLDRLSEDLRIRHGQALRLRWLMFGKALGGGWPDKLRIQ